MMDKLLILDVFTNLGNAAGKMGVSVRGVAWTIFVVAVLICAVAWIFGGRGAEFAKSTLGRVVIGVGLAALATAVIDTLAKMFGGQGTKVNFKGGLKVIAEPLKMWLATKGINLY